MNGDDLREALRQMLAVLERERQAIAALDQDEIVGTTNEKHGLCDMLERCDLSVMDEECREMVAAARRLNEINRQVRNLAAANVATRLNTLAGKPQIFYRGGRYSRQRTVA